MEQLRRAAACITDRPLMGSGHRAGPEPLLFGFVPRGDPVPLRTRAGKRGPLLAVNIQYVVARTEGDRGLYQVQTSYYAYDVLDLDGREILAYHWHPESASPIAYPHLHLSSRVRPIELGPGADPATLAEMHLPTGHITLADIVRLVITEFDVQPRRDDWETILRESLTG